MPGGALDVIAAGALDGVSRIFALHCDPRLEAGQVGMRLGAITSAADTIEVVLDSPGGHTSRPHLTTDLIYALGTVVTGLPGMLSRRIDPRTGTVMVWGGAVSAGQAPNAIPQTGMMTGTVRTGDHDTWELLEPLVEEIVHGLLAPTGVRYQLNYRRGVLRSSTTRCPLGCSRTPSRPSDKMLWRTPPRNPVVAKTFRGTSKPCRVPWRGSACGRVRAISSTSTNPLSISTSEHSASV